MNEFSLLLHDLRSPLARARTLAKLLAEASPAEREECVRLLLAALEEVDKKLSNLAEKELH